MHLKRLPVDESHIQKCNMTVTTFDGTKRDVIGAIEIPLQVGPVTFKIVFQVMDINPSYTCLLGRPWIHMAGAIPSTLHQKVKFRVETTIVSVHREKDIMAIHNNDTPYIEAAEETLECSFRSFEIDEVIFEMAMIENSEKVNVPKNQLKKKGWSEGQGLGRHIQGTLDPVEILGQENTFRLRYKPSHKDRQEMAEKKRKKRMARLEGKTLEDRIFIPPIEQSFVSARMINPSQQDEISPWAQPLIIQFSDVLVSLASMFKVGTDTEIHLLSLT